MSDKKRKTEKERRRRREGTGGDGRGVREGGRERKGGGVEEWEG